MHIKLKDQEGKEFGVNTDLVVTVVETNPVIIGHCGIQFLNGLALAVQGSVSEVVMKLNGNKSLEF